MKRTVGLKRQIYKSEGVACKKYQPLIY